MIEFEIINPHDKCFLTVPDFSTALAAIALLGEGSYGIEGGGFKAPPSPFGDWPASIYEAAGIGGILDLVHVETGRLNTDAQFNEATAAALASIRYPRKRTSTVDLARKGRQMADALRGLRRFDSIENPAEKRSP